MKKKLLLLMMAATLIFTGCGKKTEDTTKVEEGRYYKAEYVTMDAPAQGYIGGMCLDGDDLYYVLSTWDKDYTTNETTVKKFNIVTKETTDTGIVMTDSSYISDMCLDNDGNLSIYRTMVKYNADYSQIEKAEYELMVYDKDYNQMNSIDFSELAKEAGSDFYVNSVEYDKDGNLVITDGNTFVWAIDNSGAKIAEIALTDWSNGFIKAADGRLFLPCYDSNYDRVLKEVDIAGKQLVDGYTGVPDSNGNSGVIDKDGNYLVTNGNNLYSYNLDAQTNEKLLNWIDYDVNGNYLNFVNKLEDGRIVALSTEYDEGAEKTNYEIVLLTETDEPDTSKTIISFGCVSLDYSLSTALIRFNKSNDTYRIKVVDYYDGNDYATSTKALEDDIIAGKGPDVLSLDSGNYQNYAAKGILTDISALMDNDSSVNKSDYIENVLKAYEIDGTLYAMPVNFSISSVIGASSVVGTTPGWSISDMTALMDSLPADVEMIQYMDKNQMLIESCTYNLNNFVNWQTGECSFTSPEFIELLKLADKFPKEYNYSDDGDSMPTKIANKKLVLVSDSFSEMNYFQLISLMYGEEVTAVGFPGAPGNGSAINYGSITLGINDKCESKDGAWALLKYLTGEEYQTNSNDWYLPINKAAFEKVMVKESTPEMTTNEAGVEEEQPKTTWGYDDAEFAIYAATKEQVEQFKAMVYGAEILATNNEDIMNIVSEEAAAFFNGQKSAEDVADVIQSRVNIYVNENR